MSDFSTILRPPKCFTGATRYDFDMHMRHVLRYAASCGVAAVLNKDWVIEPAQPVPIPANNHPHPGPYPQDGSAAETCAWMARLDMHKLECQNNVSEREFYDRSVARRSAKIAENEHAASILTACFAASDLDRVDHVELASAKVVKLRDMFHNRTKDMLSLHWHRRWSMLALSPDADPSEIQDFIKTMAELVDERGTVFPNDDMLLPMSLAKINSNPIERVEFTLFTQTVRVEYSKSFVPPLVQAPIPAPLGLMIEGPDHNSRALQNFMDALERCKLRMLQNVAYSSALASVGKMKTCEHHGRCKHDTDSCRVIKKQESFKKKLPTKVAKGKANRCKLCSQSKHALRNCPVVKVVAAELKSKRG
ncbi:hypothetical protein HDU77_007966 [Chytriomyces hyalinus]|nr:hypothetical protein HDU77_007966 [Chytriomyces hyalinus]